jgi:hypothetical protein
MPEATASPNTIVLIGRLEDQNLEYPANAALKPGHLVLVMSTGKVKKNDAASVPCQKLFAKEDDHIGRGVADAYAADEVVFCHAAQPGDVIYGWVPASATALVKGDKVKSNGDGCLVKITASSDFVIGTVHEAVDNSAGGAEARVKVRIN